MSIEVCYESLTGYLRDYQGISIQKVTTAAEESIWDELMEKYHYLGYDRMIGQRLKYLVTYNSRIIAVIGFNRASLRVGVRDTRIGWDEENRKKDIHRIVNNNRFLILPWIRIKNLASHILSRTLKQLQKDWKERYNTELIAVETFVDHKKYKGICYLAANWEYLGETKGFGKIGNTFVYHGNKKGVYIYVLQKEALQRIQAESYHRSLKPVTGRVPIMMLQTPDWNPTILEDAGITEATVMGLGTELHEFMTPFLRCIENSKSVIYAETFVKGFLSDLQYKSAEPIALRYGVSVRGSQRFLKEYGWDSEKMSRIYRTTLSEAIAEPTGMITIDECGEPKKGNHSVGVARQYCGALGKTDNCQVGVYIGYTSPIGYGLIDRKLYLPEKWFEDDYAERRKACEIPEDTVFKTKIDIASELLKDVASSGLFPARWVGVDALYGSSKEFLRSIPEGLWYFADIHSNMLVFLEKPEMIAPEYSGKGRRDLKPKPSVAPVPIKQLADDPALPWNKVILGEGAKGLIISHEKCIRVIMCDDNAPGDTVWLYIRRFEDGSCKFSICNAPSDTPLDVIRSAALMRWPIEQCFLECKNELGLDHCEARSWNAWHRHTMLVLLAHLFLTLLRLKYKKNIRF